MTGTPIPVDQLTPELLKQLGLNPTRKHSFTKHDVRSWSLKVLAQMAGLTQEQRRRVLEHSLKVNRL